MKLSLFSDSAHFLLTTRQFFRFFLRETFAGKENTFLNETRRLRPVFWRRKKEEFTF